MRVIITYMLHVYELTCLYIVSLFIPGEMSVDKGSYCGKCLFLDKLFFASGSFAILKPISERA